MDHYTKCWSWIMIAVLGFSFSMNVGINGGWDFLSIFAVTTNFLGIVYWSVLMYKY
jgi:hypothetical protein